MKQPKNSLQLSKPTRNTRIKAKRSNIYFTHNKENKIHNIAPALTVQHLLQRKYILHTMKNNIRNVLRVLVFQQLLVDKYYKLRDLKSRSGFGRGEVCVLITFFA